jgi:Pyrimidine dimer DNA glycosylase
MDGETAMRLWTIHPRYLDSRGLVALWREALLARAVLRGKTRGYRHHPQLARFRAHRFPRSAINAYLAAIHAEAKKRGYSFDVNKIGPLRSIRLLPATTSQVEFEWRHLLRKLARRDPELCRRLHAIRRPRCHPLFRKVEGQIESWERQL